MRLQEILIYMKRDFSQYSWSLITLNRRLMFFNIYRHDKNVIVDEVTEAIKKDSKGPGQVLGYRAMYHKIRQVHGPNVTRDQVYAAMTDVDPEGLENRKRRAHFLPLILTGFFQWGGRDKLMKYQNRTFPLVVYGCVHRYIQSKTIVYLGLDI